MGCCQSSISGPDDHPGARIAPPLNGAVDQPAQVDGAAANGGDVRPNKPIRAPSPVQKSPSHNPRLPPPWTRSLLERERAAFFDTRVTGRQEVWDAVKVACEMLLHGNIAEAQGVLDAANITAPRGRVAIDKGKHTRPGGLYDVRGEIYDVPSWIVTDPRDIVEDEEEKDVDGGASDDEDDQKAAAQEDMAAQQRGQEKGKGRAESPGEILWVTARLSDSSPDIRCMMRSKDTVAVVLSEVQNQSGKRVRLMYLGRTLREDKTLLQQGWQKGHVLNAMIESRDDATLGADLAK